MGNKKFRSGLLFSILTVVNILLFIGGYLHWTQPPPENGFFDRPFSSTSSITNPNIESTGLPTNTPVPLLEVVVALQDIRRGVRIQPNMVQVIAVPEEFVPFSAFGDTEQVVGQIARTDIYREEFVLSSKIVPALSLLSGAGSDAAAVLPPNQVGATIYLPTRQLPLGLAVGDRVDVFATVTSNVTEENQSNILIKDIVMDASVVWIGPYPEDGQMFKDVTATPSFDNTSQRAATQMPAAPNLSDLSSENEIPIILSVSNQEAADILFAENAGFPITLVVRSASSTELSPISSVNLQTFLHD